MPEPDTGKLFKFLYANDDVYYYGPLLFLLTYIIIFLSIFDMNFVSNVGRLETVRFERKQFFLNGNRGTCLKLFCNQV